MKAFVGYIVAGDRTEKTFTVHCDDGVSGVMMGQRILTIPISNSGMSVYGYLKEYMNTYDPKTGTFKE